MDERIKLYYFQTPASRVNLFRAVINIQALTPGFYPILLLNRVSQTSIPSDFTKLTYPNMKTFNISFGDNFFSIANQRNVSYISRNNCYLVHISNQRYRGQQHLLYHCFVLLLVRHDRQEKASIQDLAYHWQQNSPERALQRQVLLNEPSWRRRSLTPRLLFKRYLWWLWIKWELWRI